MRRKAHINPRRLGKLHARAVLHNGPADAMQVEDDIAALVDAHLAGNDHDDAVAYARNVDGPVDMAGDDGTVSDVAQSQAGEGSAGPAAGGAARGRQSHVDNTLVQVRQGARRGGARG